MKKLFLSTVLALGWFAAPIAPAQAQTAPSSCGVNFNPVVGVNCANIRQPTYVVAMTGLVPASAATDFFCIGGPSGTATKNIHIRRWQVSGVATTLVTTPVLLIRRPTADTGTAATVTYVSLVHGYNVSNPTNTATVVGYNSTGGNPTVVAGVNYGAREITLPVSGTSAMPSDQQIWRFGTPVDSYEQGLDITKGQTVQYCLNLNGATIAGGALYGEIEWTEDQ